MPTFSEFREYSPLEDLEMVRLSMCDKYNQEYFAMIPAFVRGSGYAERRRRALDAISEAIARGDDPGEVVV